MKFRVMMKDPDTLSDAIDEAAAEAAAPVSNDPDERSAVASVKRDKMLAAASKWFKYGECLTVEIDTEAGTCIVVPN